MHFGISLQFRFELLQLLLGGTLHLLISGCGQLILLCHFLWKSLLLFGLAQRRAGFRDVGLLFERLEMLCDGFECSDGLFLLFGCLRQFLLPGSLFAGRRSLLQLLIHAFGRGLNQCEAVIAVPRAFPLLFIGQILPCRIFDECLHQILDAVVGQDLLLLQFGQLGLIGHRWLFFGVISHPESLFLQFAHLGSCVFCQLSNGRGKASKDGPSSSHSRLQILQSSGQLRRHSIQFMAGRGQHVPSPAAF